MRKSIEELKKINTPNLLRYYRAERKRFYNASYRCRCGCGEFIWELDTSCSHIEEKYDAHVNYLNLIKAELNTREHVDKK
jgi:hypothetical protein